MPAADFKCFLVEKDSSGKVHRSITRRPLSDLPPGDVLIRVQYSSLNYKDALAAEAHPGVVRKALAQRSGAAGGSTSGFQQRGLCLGRAV
ncbi:MAG: hypothetical protein K8R36_18060 [Planctomycetales bacterium]|nr:hypothetical protein [Planctomycetales bacterium]